MDSGEVIGKEEQQGPLCLVSREGDLDSQRSSCGVEVLGKRLSSSSERRHVFQWLLIYDQLPSFRR